MSVLKNKRGLSKLEFYHTARNLRKEITAMLLRDFGVKVKNPKGGKPLPLAALEDTAEEDNGI